MSYCVLYHAKVVMNYGVFYDPEVQAIQYDSQICVVHMKR
jgi:hypothetical protein